MVSITLKKIWMIPNKIVDFRFFVKLHRSGPAIIFSFWTITAFGSITNMLRAVQKLKIIAGRDLWNLTKKWKSTILSENLHNPSRVINTDYLDEVLINLALIRSFCWSITNMLRDSSKTKIIAGPDMWNLTKNWKSTILSETIHNPSRVILTIFKSSW